MWNLLFWKSKNFWTFSFSIFWFLLFDNEKPTKRHFYASLIFIIIPTFLSFLSLSLVFLVCIRSFIIIVLCFSIFLNLSWFLSFWMVCLCVHILLLYTFVHSLLFYACVYFSSFYHSSQSFCCVNLYSCSLTGQFVCFIFSFLFIRLLLFFCFFICFLSTYLSTFFCLFFSLFLLLQFLLPSLLSISLFQPRPNLFHMRANPIKILRDPVGQIKICWLSEKLHL